MKYLFDASFEAISVFCVEKKVLWKYDLSIELIADLNGKADRRETCSITINLLGLVELLGMVMTAWIMLELVGDRADAKGDSMLMHGDDMTTGF